MHCGRRKNRIIYIDLCYIITAILINRSVLRILTPVRAFTKHSIYIDEKSESPKIRVYDRMIKVAVIPVFTTLINEETKIQFVKNE